MSIIENWEARRVEETATARTAVRVFNVEFDTQDAPTARPILALNATTPELSVPPYGAEHPFDRALFCIKRTVEPKGAFIFDVTCNYSTLTYESAKEKNPLKQKPEISWTFVTTDEPIDCDIMGNPIVNSAEESFDPPITDERHDLVLRYVRNESKFNPEKANKYKGAVNSGSFLGFKAGLVKCAIYDADEINDEQFGDYFKVTYEFHFRSIEIKGKVYGWVKRILDQGYRKKVSDSPPTWENFKDEDGNPVSQPVLLDGEGDKLNTSGTVKGVFLTFETRKKLPFSALKIKV